MERIVYENKNPNDDDVIDVGTKNSKTEISDVFTEPTKKNQKNQI